MDQMTPRPAATIVVIREQNQKLEILMLRRSAQAAAASGAHVFPGGGVDEVDAEVVRRGLVAGLDAASAGQRLELGSGALAYYCAALRELFEEAGLLIALNAAGDLVEVSDVQLVAWRAELVTAKVGWPEFLEREGLRLALGEMHYLAHWVTPENRSRRFDTRFFLAVAPVGQVARADGHEVTEHLWTTASAALHLLETAQWTMLVPTVHTLRRLAAMGSVDEALAHATTSRVQRTQPREVEHEGRIVVVLPGEPGYDD